MKVSEVLARLAAKGIGGEASKEVTEGGMVFGWSGNPVFVTLSMMPADEELDDRTALAWIEEAHIMEAEVEPTIAQAIAAERERCAKIAEDLPNHHCEGCCSDVAELIRDPDASVTEKDGALYVMHAAAPRGEAK